MEPAGYVIVSLNLFCLLPSLILVAGASRNDSALSRMFILLVVMNMLGLIAEASAWLFEYNSSVTSYYAVRIADFTNHTAGYVKLGIFGEYIHACLAPRITVSRRPFRVIWIISGLSFAILIMAQFTGLYAGFDELNVYHAQGTFYISQMLLVTNIAVIFYVTVLYGRHLPRLQLAALRWYFGLLLLCTVLFFVVSTALALHYIVSTLSQIVLYINIQMDEARRREIEIAESRNVVMISQISPHFLMNVLTGISALCRQAPEQAQQALMHFSRYLRGNMDSLTCRVPIPFEKELEHVMHYLWLESIRFEEKLRVVYEITARDFKVPALSLQPLVENAVRHGLAGNKDGGTVVVRTEETDKLWRIIVSDNGAGFDPAAEGVGGERGVGLDNTRSRLAAMCGGRLTIAALVGKGTAAVIEIPKSGEEGRAGWFRFFS